ncbi:MAG: ROK family transcriptional regulator [Planctomycetaceae bacterium]
MTTSRNRIESTLLRRINERRLLEAIQRHGPSSRAMLTRVSGLTAPTVSKAVDSLLQRGFLEDLDPIEQAFGRPGRLVRMARESAHVLGVVIDAGTCCVVSTGLDGAVTEERTLRFATGCEYPVLLDAIESACRTLMGGCGSVVRGVGVSVPGLFNGRRQEIVFSPNLHLLDRQRPAHDLERRLGVPCRVIQESDALVLGERMFGDARDLEDFAVLDAATGLGLGVMNGGRLLAGHSGMAGEIGHVTVRADGDICGCGNRGCLETLATDSALRRMMEERMGIGLDSQQAGQLLATRAQDFEREIGIVVEYLAIAIAAVINIFNPSVLFVHGALVAGAPELFARVL